ncbi:MAG: PEGA domain-containing protein [Candidatus Cloacimonetes bacterium]|nr:PEGA domain-containing protein [Candidatus Cloacimonadota bacterium]
MLNEMKSRIISGKKLIIVLLVIISLNLFSAEFIVKDFKEQPMDIELQRNPVKDVNGEYAALIKISTDLIPFSFQTNIGVVKTEKKVGEFWAYVPADATQLIFTKQDFSKLRYPVPITIKSNKVYTMKLASVGYGIDIADENLVQITFNLNEENIFIALDESSPIQKKEKYAVFKIPKGEHTFKFFKQGFDEITRAIDIQEEETISIIMQQGQTLEKMSLPGFIDITSKPDGAEIYVNDQKMGVTPANFELTAGEHKLTIRKYLHHTYSGTFVIEEGESKILEKINLISKFGYYEVTSIPVRASVFLDNKLIGKSPISRGKIESGTHTLRAEYELYHTETIEIVIKDGDDEKFELALKPAFGVLSINSKPIDGANIFIDDDRVGITPYIKEKIPSGKYRVRIGKELWMGAEQMVTVNDGKTTEKTLLLTKNFANLKVTADNSKIYLNNDFVANNSFLKKLIKGKHKIKATRDKHYDAEQEIYITPGNDLEIELSPKPKLVSLTVKSNPYESKGSDIYLNEKKQKETTPAVFELLIGKYDVIIKHPRFLEQTKFIELKELEQGSIIFDLQTYKGSMLSQADKWKRSKWISLISSCILAGGGVYCNSVGDGYLDDYDKSYTTANAVSNRDSFEKWYNYRDVTYYISIGPLVYGLYSWIKEAQFNKLAESNKSF